MKKLIFVAACALAISGCAEMAQQDQQSQQASERRPPDPDDYVTGSRIARKAPKNSAPAEAQAGGDGIRATSVTR